MPKPAEDNRRYMPGLDGLRALAVLAVIAYHLNLSVAPGGLLGVGIFFVLSGYLITDLFISQWQVRGRMNLKGFWLSRARRLLPAMLLMLSIVVLWVVLFDRSELSTLWGDAISAVFYFSNWWFIFHKVSYFHSFGLPSPLKHLWSLAVEEQFYLIWPLLLAVALRLRVRRGQLVGWTLLGVAASALTMALLYHPGSDPSRVYYGTDTRAFSLLVGAVLALMWPSRRLSKRISVKSLVALDLFGGIGLLVVIAMILFTNEYASFLYRGGMLLLSIATAILVAALAHPSTRLSRWIGCRPLRWIGVRSYGIYLWHYPVIILTSSAVNTGSIHVTRALLQVGASIALAALSWAYVEQPIRHGALARAWAQFRVANHRRHHAPMIAGGIGVAFATVTMVSWTAGRFTLIADADAHGMGQNSAAQYVYSANGSNVPDGSNPSNHAGASAVAGRANATNSTTPEMVYGSGNRTSSASSGTSANLPGQDITAIGDSIMVGLEPYLKKDLPGIVVDGKVGRQMSQAPAVVDQLKAKGKLGQRVIIELGTNGIFREQQLISLLTSLANEKQIILVNTRVPRPWEKPVNATLAQVAKMFGNTTLVNWYQASANKGSIFYPDGVHLKPDGSKFLASLLEKAVDEKASSQKIN